MTRFRFPRYRVPVDVPRLVPGTSALEETVPLSEEEMRLLEQMERALVAEDPKFASTLRGTRMRHKARRNMILGIVSFVVGIAVLMAGAVLRITPLGIAGFVIMLGSAYVALTSWRGQNNAPVPTAGPGVADPGLRVIQGGKSRRPKRGRSPKHGSMMERFEERWRRRRDQNGGL
jgi:hypothetical protein